MASDIPGTAGSFGTPGAMKSYGDFSTPTGVSMRDLQGRYTSGGWGFEWIGLQGVMDLPDTFGEFIADTIEHNVSRLAERIEAYAKTNAPWTDRTGDARSGLKTTEDSNRETGKYVINLGYSVDYGFYLENSNGGQFAIVRPAMQRFAHQMSEMSDPEASFQ